MLRHVQVTKMANHGWQQSNWQFWHFPQQNQGPSINLRDTHLNEKSVEAGTRTNAVMQDAFTIILVKSVSTQDQQSNAANHCQGQREVRTCWEGHRI